MYYNETVVKTIVIIKAEYIVTIDIEYDRLYFGLDSSFPFNNLHFSQNVSVLCLRLQTLLY